MTDFSPALASGLTFPVVHMAKIGDDPPRKQLAGIRKKPWRARPMGRALARLGPAAGPAQSTSTDSLKSHVPYRNPSTLRHWPWPKPLS